jgi:TolB-like protein
MTVSSRAVFLSYASQDGEAAGRICESLRAAGIEVWFDRSELRGGDAWDQKIRREIRECALFIPVISANTALRREGYFRLEWGLAEQRAQMLARNAVFIVPVALAGAPERSEDVPESFLRVQWTRLHAADTSASFSRRIASLLAEIDKPELIPATGQSGPVRLGRGHTSFWTAIALAIILIGTAVALKPWQRSAMKTAAVKLPTPIAENISPAGEKSIAVLPFVDMSAKHDQEYFSDGLSEELIDQLSHNAKLKVIARTSSFVFKGKNEDMRSIATKLGVGNILEGSVRMAGANLRITAQLIRASDGVHLWSQTYDRKLSDIFRVQEEISKKVATALNVVLRTGAQPTAAAMESVEAYNLVLQGNYYHDRNTGPELIHAIGLYKEALKVDPNSALALVQLASAYFIQADGGGISSPEGSANAKRMATEALRINANLMKAHEVLALAYMVLDWNWGAARSEIETMRVIDPGDTISLPLALATYSGIVGRLPEAISLLEGLAARNPLDPTALSNLAYHQCLAEEYEECLATNRRLSSVSPDFGGVQTNLGIALLHLGHDADALAAIEKEPDESTRLAGLTILYWSSGRRRDSDAAFQGFRAKASGENAYDIASLYAYRGDFDAAFKWLDVAYQHHESGLAWLKSDPLLRNIRGDSRFSSLLKRMNLPET